MPCRLFARQDNVYSKNDCAFRAQRSTYRTLLRSSSIHEPSDPPMRLYESVRAQALMCCTSKPKLRASTPLEKQSVYSPPSDKHHVADSPDSHEQKHSTHDAPTVLLWIAVGNDPAARSRTATLLRLLLSPNHRDQTVSRRKRRSAVFSRKFVPSSDGRCVQRTGT